MTDIPQHRESGTERKTGMPRREMLIRSILAIGGGEALRRILETDAKADEHKLSKELENLINEKWHGKEVLHDKQFAEIAALGMQRYYETRDHPEEAFFSAEEIRAGKDVCRCCSDEGNTEVLNDAGEKMMLQRSPGSGILDALDLDDKNAFDPKFIEEQAQDAVDAGVTKFCSHVGCGAARGVYEARLAWLRANGKDNEADDLAKEGLEAYAKRWAQVVANRMRVIARELGVSHANAIHATSIEKLNRPKDIHVARIIYVTDDDAFDSSYTEFPQGFVERTGGASLNKVLRHVDILRRIGFHETHGFGTKFKADPPTEQFVICCVANEPHRLEAIMAHARKQVSTLEPPEVRTKIRVDGFIRNR